MSHYSTIDKKTFIQKPAFILWLLISLAMLAYAFWTPVHPDEAYYWTWSQHLALSYYDGPPLTAWVLRLITDIFGTHVWSIKLLAVASVSISALLLYRLAVLLFDYDVALKALVIFLFIPITQATNFISSLDPLLMLFWTLALYVFWLWLEKPTITSTIVLGCILGLGFLAKYPMILFLPSAFLTLLLLPCRNYLLNYKPYLAILVIAILALPVIIWNQEHHWISLSFQWHHGTHSHHLSPHYFEMFLLGQLGAFNPIYFIALIILSIRYYKDYRMEQCIFLIVPTIVVLALFGYFGLFNKSEANWTMPGYLSASILLAYFFDKHSFSWTYWAGILLNIAIIILLKFPYFLPARFVESDPIVKYYGYEQVIDKLANNIPHSDLKLPIITDRYQDASEIQLAMHKHPQVCIVTPTRPSVTTMLCKQLKQKLQATNNKTLWIGPHYTLPIIQQRMQDCQVITDAHYIDHYSDRRWVAAVCEGKLKDD